MSDDAWTEFQAPYRVRFDEAGPDGQLRTSGLLRYAQDIAWIHSIARGFDRAWYRARELNWVVRAVDLDVVGEIPMGSNLEATTRVIGHRRVWARRLGEFSLDGTLVARVRTDWLLLDRSNRPTRLPAEFEGAFATLTASDAIGRVVLPDMPANAARQELRVRPQELDPMDHVNNAVYVDWLEEAIASIGDDRASTRRIPRRVRLEYAGAAEPDAGLVGRLWHTAEGWLYHLGTASGAAIARGAYTRG
jgi:acyl-ACP thioesterase